jgi:hypothetical protein
MDSTNDDNIEGVSFAVAVDRKVVTLIVLGAVIVTSIRELSRVLPPVTRRVGAK